MNIINVVKWKRFWTEYARNHESEIAPSLKLLKKPLELEGIKSHLWKLETGDH